MGKVTQQGSPRIDLADDFGQAVRVVVRDLRVPRGVIAREDRRHHQWIARTVVADVDVVELPHGEVDRQAGPEVDKPGPGVRANASEPQRVRVKREAERRNAAERRHLVAVSRRRARGPIVVIGEDLAVADRRRARRDRRMVAVIPDDVGGRGWRAIRVQRMDRRRGRKESGDPVDVIRVERLAPIGNPLQIVRKRLGVRWTADGGHHGGGRQRLVNGLSTHSEVS